MAFSLLLCAVYVCISVVIDLSIARQANVNGEDYRFEPMCAVLLTEALVAKDDWCFPNPFR